MPEVIISNIYSGSSLPDTGTGEIHSRQLRLLCDICGGVCAGIEVMSRFYSSSTADSSEGFLVKRQKQHFVSKLETGAIPNIHVCAALDSVASFFPHTLSPASLGNVFLQFFSPFLLDLRVFYHRGCIDRRWLWRGNAAELDRYIDGGIAFEEFKVLIER